MHCNNLLPSKNPRLRRKTRARVRRQREFSLHLVALLRAEEDCEHDQERKRRAAAAATTIRLSSSPSSRVPVSDQSSDPAHLGRYGHLTSGNPGAHVWPTAR